LDNFLSNELDNELERRGLKFCRYADDANIYVKSIKAANRVMASITRFIEQDLKLKVNKTKSSVDRQWKLKFLGFSFYRREENIRTRVHQKSVDKLILKVKAITSRSNAMGIAQRLLKLKQTTMGWINYFRIADMRCLLGQLDEWIRRRLRMCIWKQWKKVKTKFNNLIDFGINRYKAYEWANTRKGYWRIANSPILSRTLSNNYLKILGFQSMSKRFSLVT
jgi:hypothetical protein